MSQKTKLLLTGSSGFVGTGLIKSLNKNRWYFHKVNRNFNLNQFQVKQYDCLIHLAGRAHILSESASNALNIYRDTNLHYTIKIAELAKFLQVKRIIFVSSVKVNGEYSTKPINEFSVPKPLDAYGISKLEAEEALKAFCNQHGMEYVIIRPPLIYGPEVKANFKALVKLAALPLPLPLGGLQNKRSFISLDNLCDFLKLCCEHPLAANQTFLISDDADVSTTTLIRTLRKAMGKPAWLFPVSAFFLKAIFTLIGKKHYSDRILGNLQVDITKAKALLGWKPVISFEEGIRRTVEAYVD